MGGFLFALTSVLSGCGQAATAPEALPGDPRAGLSIFKYQSCAFCHAISQVSVGGSHPAAGPALDGVGGRRSLASLRAVLTADLPHTKLPRLADSELSDLISYLATLR